jgi:hypothetical protein
MSTTRKPFTASIPAPTITSAPSLQHILVSPTTPIKKSTSDVHDWSTTPKISSSTLLEGRENSVELGSSTTLQGTTQSAVSSTIPPFMVLAVLGDAKSPRLDRFQINSSGCTLQRPIFGRNDPCYPSQLALGHLDCLQVEFESISMCA